jgi:hypothetical protein
VNYRAIFGSPFGTGAFNLAVRFFFWSSLRPFSVHPIAANVKKTACFRIRYGWDFDSSEERLLGRHNLANGSADAF